MCDRDRETGETDFPSCFRNGCRRYKKPRMGQTSMRTRQEAGSRDGTACQGWSGRDRLVAQGAGGRVHAPAHRDTAPREADAHTKKLNLSLPHTQISSRRMINLCEEQNYKTSRDSTGNRLNDPTIGKDFLSKSP